MDKKKLMFKMFSFSYRVISGPQHLQIKILLSKYGFSMSELWPHLVDGIEVDSTVTDTQNLQ